MKQKIAVLRLLTTLAFVLTVSLVGLAAYLVCRPQVAPSGPVVQVEEPVRDLGERPLGQSLVVFRLTNPGDRPLRVGVPPEG